MITVRKCLKKISVFQDIQYMNECIHYSVLKAWKFGIHTFLNVQYFFLFIVVAIAILYEMHSNDMLS
jgi:hypothetical protein